MYQEEKTFTLRFSLEASFPDDYEGDEENQAWVREWDTRIKPDLVKALFESLRQWIGLVSGTRAVTTAEAPFVVTRLAEEQA